MRRTLETMAARRSELEAVQAAQKAKGEKAKPPLRDAVRWLGPSDEGVVVFSSDDGIFCD